MKKLLIIFTLIAFLASPVFAADGTINDQSALGARPATDDTFPMWDASTGTTKKVTFDNMVDVNNLDSYGGITAAVASIGATETTVLCDSTQTISDNLSVPTTLLIIATRACSLEPAAGKTLTMNSIPIAGHYQITGGSGTVTFAGNGIIPQIWSGGSANSFNIGPAGVRVTTDGDGAVTILGLGDGFDEDITINLDDTSNTATLSSSTGLNKFKLSGIAYVDATTNVTATGPTDNLNLAGINTVFLDASSNNVTIGGVTGTVSGQTIQFILTAGTNSVTMEHAESTGNQDLYLASNGDETKSGGYGGWTFKSNGTNLYQVGGSGDTLIVLTTATTDTTLLASECNGKQVYINTGASTNINYTMPTGASNLGCTFEVGAAQYFRNTASGTDTFRYYDGQSAAGGYIRSNTTGTRWKLTWNGTDWTVHDLIGTVDFDQ